MKVYALHTTTYKWQQLPDLNFARSNHGSTCLGDAVFVVGGYDTPFNYINSIERLKMGANHAEESQTWSLIDIHQLTPRFYPVLSQIGPDELCILGGHNSDYKKVSDGFILNVKTLTVTKINPASQIKFVSYSESFMKTYGLLLSLVHD